MKNPITKGTCSVCGNALSGGVPCRGGHKIEAAPGDICECGDYRSDHPDNGACNLNGLGHNIPRSEPEAKCLKFRLSLPTITPAPIGDYVTPCPSCGVPVRYHRQLDHDERLLCQKCWDEAKAKAEELYETLEWE